MSNSNIFWYDGKVTKAARNMMNNHESCVIWFTGLSASGKSSLATEVEKILYDYGIHTYILDGDNIRHGLNKNLGFNPEDRKENIRRISEVTKLFVDAGLFVLVASISPYREERDNARAMFASENFIEVYVKCDIKECMKRDPKGLYKKAEMGLINNLTGVSSPYEEPLQPEIVVNNDAQSLEESSKQVLQYLITHKKIPVANN